MPLEPGQKLSHYRLVEKIGEGGMGVVWRARDEKLRRDVALKVLPAELVQDPERRRRLLREARSAAAINHPNIGTVHEVDEAAGTVFIAMELVEGNTLRSLLGGQPMPIPEALRIATEIAEGLVAAHEVSVIHRDLKPENVLVRPDGNVKILDFGLAKVHEAPSPADSQPSEVETVTHRMTREGRILGTPAYMSPEQTRGEAVDARSDLFSFGSMLYEMVTGKVPFEGRTHADTFAAILSQPARPPSQLNADVPTDLERILGKCLEKDPKERYHDTEDLAVDLRKLRGTTETGVPAFRGAARRSLRKTWIPTAAAVALLAAVTAIYLSMRESPPPPPPAASGGAQIDSLVALPSKVFASDGEGWLADAIPNTLSSRLDQIEGLDTKVPPTSVDVERLGGDLDTLADAYGVAAFVRSTITADAERFVLNVQLVEARSRSLLWSEEYEGSREGYLDLARQAAEGLRQWLRPTAAQVETAAGRTASAEAELAFQRGRYHWNRYNNLHRTEDFDLAVSAYEQALGHDPGLADAAADIAYLFLFRMESGAPADEVLPEIERWARRSLAIDPRTSRGWSALASLSRRKRQEFRELLEDSLRAAAFGPRDPHAHNGLGETLSLTSILLAREAYRESSRLDPLYLYPPLNAAHDLAGLGRSGEGLRLVEGVLRMEPGMPTALRSRGKLLIDLGRIHEVEEILVKLDPMVAEGRTAAEDVAVVRDGAELFGAAPDTSRAARDRLVETVPELSWYEYNTLLVVPWLARKGAAEQAIDILTRHQEDGILLPFDFLRLNPDLQRLPGNPRFERVLERSRTQLDEMREILDEARARGELPAYLEEPLADLLVQLGIQPS